MIVSMRFAIIFQLLLVIIISRRTWRSLLLLLGTVKYLSSNSESLVSVHLRAQFKPWVFVP